MGALVWGVSVEKRADIGPAMLIHQDSTALRACYLVNTFLFIITTKSVKEKC